MIIKQLRKQSHLSQEQLAESTKLSLRTIQRAEAGHRISFASLRSLAGFFNKDVDRLEQELYSIDNITEYKDYPFWLRLYIGSGWFSATRKEFERIEVFFAILAFFTGLISLTGFYISYGATLLSITFDQLMGLACITLILGAYNCSISIRLGDKYDIWSKLEATQPKPLFHFLTNIRTKKKVD
ncbi:helix-turn-helix transcriptional regulator [Thalassotalea sp. M1531]|uniref:Helix-turn-helix transcriptional regulator n=1 Tax=Thalassotalea algicola TaxID=2716224 RepID=A0A7Y0LDT8_9GAMM|nr:helix-turn-helix transcriptional regulator [Thalassotalea algicola]NMP32715.1 helix-turn-helix transcriptional regulator [Thalassotalea algicola]